MKNIALVFCSIMLLASTAPAQNAEPPAGMVNAPAGNIAKQALETSHPQNPPPVIVVAPSAMPIILPPVPFNHPGSTTPVLPPQANGAPQAAPGVGPSY